ncbi:chitin synthase-domain-containing protein [Zychaea mexicana]|uniref:chitin synthase-domain-containing protein n=1 Tax=Zychaea mexicana TaxID=64656 RepID=UPI0022FEED93|nr:chitin synthase-domain-containing protein [Zychaea mexicana]KAI9496149.1 chitin synthase-domain-containing protein [Zychaea mexicana]
MAFVGFLTFGFTQTVCPRPPLSFRVNKINSGYVIVHGWAYMLASWNDHPIIAELTDEPTNPVYPPIDAGGKDASFLFQSDEQGVCTNVFTPKISGQPQQTDGIYFPCQLFDPMTTNVNVPSSSSYTNQTGCHKSQKARDAFKSMQEYGVPNGKGGYDKAGRVYYDWEDIAGSTNLAVYNSHVLNLDLLRALPLDRFNVPSAGLIEQALGNTAATAPGLGGQDLTRLIASHRESGSLWRQEASCLMHIIKVGEIDTKSVGCIASDVVLYVSLVVILGVILVKFVLAVAFGWFLSWRLGNFKEAGSYRDRMERDEEIENWASEINRPADAIRPQERQQQQRYSVASNPYAIGKSKRKTLMPRTSRFTQPEPGTTHFNGNPERPVSTIWRNSPRYFFSRYLGTSMVLGDNNGSCLSLRRPSDVTPSSRPSTLSDSTNMSNSTVAVCPFPVSRHAVPQPKPEFMPFGFALTHTICLVTCYSEGVDGLRTTLDSIATTDYPNSHKLILVIADGMITGHGNDKSTPDICVSMMENFLVEPDEVEPYSYVAIADGSKRHNMAKVYSGFYKYDDTTVDPSQQQRVPMITIAKCGTPEEANDRKPGNRGKRDSQVILMSFLQKVMFDERMTMLEYEFFNNIWRVTGVSADKYEICLMVDADTKVYPDALSRLISCMVNDEEVAGLCGETKIGNKTDSWVSMIQVFEYYISHHQSKAFESIFGNVTCLPGCFCMYRIKAPKGANGHWVPILANPDIIEHYSENVVDTLHKKNLLLLGEDRYLSTLMLRTFPRRKMLFVPQAVCKTVVPDSFRVLLSQRRRWINSTIHNLFELLLVSDLCGTFCFSMQFVVFMELVGTLALPAAISFTLYLIILAILGQPAVVSLILLALILGLPAVLIVMTSRKIVYVGWMFIYLFSLPIWNFVLPTYAYWHFDDFTWGETRKVEGSGKDEAHGDKEGEFDSSKITMKRWNEYERVRKIREAQEKQRRLAAQRYNNSNNRYSYYPSRPSSPPRNFLPPVMPFSSYQRDSEDDWMEEYMDPPEPLMLPDTRLPMPRYHMEQDEKEEDWETSVIRSMESSAKPAPPPPSASPPPELPPKSDDNDNVSTQSTDLERTDGREESEEEASTTVAPHDEDDDDDHLRQHSESEHNDCGTDEHHPTSRSR